MAGLRGWRRSAPAQVRLWGAKPLCGKRLATPAMVVQPALRVLLRGVGGQELELEVDPQNSVSDVKQRISELWQVPAPVQRLIVGTEVLEDSEALCSYRQPEDETLPILVVVSLVGVTGDLEHQDWQKRKAALHALKRLGQRGGETATAAVFARLEDHDSDVRRAALEALPRVVEKGNERAIAAISARLEDGSSDVRKAAVEALIQVTERGDQRAIQAAGARLDHSDGLVRKASLDALRKVAEKGDEGTIEAVSMCLEDHDGTVRYAALVTITQVAEKGDNRAVAAVRAGLFDGDASVRRVSIEKAAELGMASVCALM